jgi:hypothetical protein
VIRWRSREDWQGISAKRLDELERRFREAVPEDAWELLETRSYEAVGPG